MHRPWGSYQSVDNGEPVDNGERHQVKRIVVKPGMRRLSKVVSAPIKIS